MKMPSDRWRRSITTGVAALAMQAAFLIALHFVLPAHDNARSLKPEERPMVDERPLLAASEIEEELLAELQKLPTLHDAQSVMIRPYSGPKSWTWELDNIQPKVGPEQSKFAAVTNVVARLQQQYDLDLSPPPPA
jgi:hypothetical protein